MTFMPNERFEIIKKLFFSKKSQSFNKKPKINNVLRRLRVKKAFF